MTLLFDENLSFRLAGATSPQFPSSRHVRDVGLASARDRAIWEFAKREGLTIVTFDSDFHERSLLEGCPPKIIWLRTGNTATATIRSSPVPEKSMRSFLIAITRVLLSPNRPKSRARSRC